MPLDRAHVTVASRIMLAVYPSLNLLYGVVFILDPQRRLESAPSLDPARDLLALWQLGLLWLALSAVMVLAWTTAGRERYVQALAVNAAAWALWALVVEAAVFTQPNVTYLAGTLPLFVAIASVASLRSLRAGER